MKTYRTGVVGTGFIGKVHIETVRRLGNVSVVALADKFNADKTAAALNVPDYFTDYKEMIDTMNLDMLHICTPNNTHFEIAMYALDHGVNVILEKPMCATVEEARLLVEKADACKLVAAINFHNRFYPMNNHLKNVIKDGELGEIFSVTGSYTQDWLLYETDYSWRLNSAESGKTRAVADIGSHWMDLAEYVTGQKIIAVNADFQTIHPTRKKPKTQDAILAFSQKSDTTLDYEDIPIDTEDNASILFRFSNGAKGSAFFSQVIAGKSVSIDVLIGGYNKSAQWKSEMCNQLTIGNRDSYNALSEKGIATVHPNTLPLVDYPFGHLEGFPDAFKQCFKSIYANIETPDAPHEYADFKDGLHEMILCEKIYESSQTSQWIEVTK